VKQDQGPVFLLKAEKPALFYKFWRGLVYLEGITLVFTLFFSALLSCFFFLFSLFLGLLSPMGHLLLFSNPNLMATTPKQYHKKDVLASRFWELSTLKRKNAIDWPKRDSYNTLNTVVLEVLKNDGSN
jgi:hypothetical protein